VHAVLVAVVPSEVVVATEHLVRVRGRGRGRGRVMGLGLG
jgi:hypothetical protein